MNRLRKFITLFLLGVASVFSSAQVPIEEANLHVPTGIAPLYFGPNAFPVPDMLTGWTDVYLRAELAGEGYFGKAGDKTGGVFAKLTVPLFTRWAALSVWLPVQEWYKMTPERQAECRLQDTAVISGHGTGDVYISTNIQLLSGHFSCFSENANRWWIPGLELRVGLKTASGGEFGNARHFDNPGYWFDMTLGENLTSLESPVSLAFSGSAGFLCWQTDNGRQNDAVMYGLQLQMRSEYVSLTASWTGYSGWERYGDRPMVVRATLAGHVEGFEPFVTYQYGIRDYPFQQVRVGLRYDFPLLGRERESFVHPTGILRKKRK